MGDKKMLKLYIKIFLIILAVGLILPSLIDFILNLVFYFNSKNHPGGSIFVFGYDITEKNYFYYVIKLLEKIIDFS